MTTHAVRARARSRRLLASFPIALTVAIAITAVAVPAHPQSTDAGAQQIAELVSGRWRLGLSERAAQGRIDRAIDQVTRQMLPIVSGIAAGRLRDANPISRTLDVSVDPRRVRVEFEDATFETAPGHPRRMRRPGHESEMIVVTQLVRDGHLEQVFTSRDGRRWNSFHPSADGSRLELEAVVQSPQLPQALRYRLPYERAR